MRRAGVGPGATSSVSCWLFTPNGSTTKRHSHQITKIDRDGAEAGSFAAASSSSISVPAKSFGLRKMHRPPVRADLRLAVAEDARARAPAGVRARRGCRPPRSRDDACRRRDCAPGTPRSAKLSPSGSSSSMRVFGRSTKTTRDAVLGQRLRLATPARRACRDRAAPRRRGRGPRSRHGSAGRASRRSVAHMRHMHDRLRLLSPRRVDLAAHRAPHRFAHRLRRRGAAPSAAHRAPRRPPPRRSSRKAAPSAIGLRHAEQRDGRILQHSPLSESTIATLTSPAKLRRRRSATPLASCETSSRPSR